METEQNTTTFKTGYKLLLYLFVAFDIYYCLRYLFLSYQIPEHGWIRFSDSFTGYFIAIIFINLYPFSTGLMLKNKKQVINGEEGGFQYNTSTRSFGEGLITFSLIVYFLLFVSFIVRMFEN